MLFGWATNCLPAALPARLAFVVAAYSCGLRALIAFSGRYLSPVSEDFLPDLVVHFWSPQAFKDFWLLANALITYIHRQRLCISWLLIVLFWLTIDLRQYRVSQQL
jgi:hypothetical protein